MLGDAVAFLRCPVCSAGMRLDGRVVRCANGHGFDVARQGYVNLAPAAGAAAGDTAAMVDARVAFLAGGHYEPIARAVVDAAAGVAAAGCVVDVGAGTGWYLARVLGRRGSRVGIALDASRYAARRAARAHPRVASVVCDAWRAIPVADEVAAVVLSVFAPRNGPEIARVLRADGALVVVTPTPRHLAELVEPLGLLSVDARKDERLERALGPGLEPVSERSCEFRMELSGDEVTQLVAMGPSAHHVPPAELRDRIAALGEPVAVTASVSLAVRRRSSG